MAKMTWPDCGMEEVAEVLYLEGDLFNFDSDIDVKNCLLGRLGPLAGMNAMYYFLENREDVELRCSQLRYPSSHPLAVRVPEGPALEERSLSELILDPEVSGDWVRQRNHEASEYMQHLLAVSFLMDDKNKVERYQFLNERLKRLGQSIESEDQLNAFWVNTIAAGESAGLLRAAAPKTYAQVRQYIDEQKINDDLTAAGWPSKRVTPGLRSDLKLQKAFSLRVDPADGQSRWKENLKSMKGAFLRGLGDKRVALGVSGAILGMTVMAGAGPAGLVIGGLRFGAGLLSTERGKLFQKNLFSGAAHYFSVLGVKPEILNRVSNGISSTVESALASKWGKRIVIGMAVGAMTLGAYDAVGLQDVAVSAADPVLIPEQLPGASVEVVAGDTLSTIARDHLELMTGERPNADEVARWVTAIQIENQIPNKDLIFSGQHLTLPSGDVEVSFAQQVEHWADDLKSKVPELLGRAQNAACAPRF